MGRPEMYVGDKFNHPKFGEYEVIIYNSSRDVIIRFCRTGHITKTCTTRARHLQVRDPKQQLVFGVGKSYSEKYKTRIKGKKTPQYAAWENMLARCYYEKTSRFSAYGDIGVTVCDEWLTFEKFAEWYDKNYIEGYHLDKDLLGNGLLYSPEYCCYIPQRLNGVFVVHSKNIGRPQSHLPTGIYHQGNGFTSSAFDGKAYFKTKEEAHIDYLTRKWNYVRELATEMYRWTEITERVYEAVLDKCHMEQEPLRTVYA